MRGLRWLAMLVLTGLVIELALMPVAFYHFHRAGIYGALANTIAIPLTTFVAMPLIALALLLDSIGLGAPFWWLAGKSLELLLGIAHWTAARPGAVNHIPAMGEWRFVLFLAGALVAGAVARASAAAGPDPGGHGGACRCSCCARLTC